MNYLCERERKIFVRFTIRISAMRIHNFATKVDMKQQNDKMKNSKPKEKKM